MGKKLRDDPAASPQEDGLRNCIGHIENYLSTGSTCTAAATQSISITSATYANTSTGDEKKDHYGTIQNSLYDFSAISRSANYCSNNSNYSNYSNNSMSSSYSNSGTASRNSLKLHCHHAEAPEETHFLFSEVIERNVYFKHGIAIFTAASASEPQPATAAGTNNHTITVAKDHTMASAAVATADLVSEPTTIPTDEEEVVIVDVGANVGFFSI